MAWQSSQQHTMLFRKRPSRSETFLHAHESNGLFSVASGKQQFMPRKLRGVVSVPVELADVNVAQSTMT
eukprot:CAMPEP_0197485076 /NCGR_PEP_ID=MMETSP1311-20131121/78_1 /TAXON_ID=464262 /ORGANISM="Genus nov. species nov., Strain RCC856" /LENGTH=68 /DNA_ID=CAMNT_0043027729 /DNA_START=508 /DNA_END=711 /DNA_ORIENTATION=+